MERRVWNVICDQIHESSNHGLSLCTIMRSNHLLFFCIPAPCIYDMFITDVKTGERRTELEWTSGNGSHRCSESGRYTVRVILARGVANSTPRIRDLGNQSSELILDVENDDEEYESHIMREFHAKAEDFERFRLRMPFVLATRKRNLARKRLNKAAAERKMQEDAASAARNLRNQLDEAAAALKLREEEEKKRRDEEAKKQRDEEERTRTRLDQTIQPVVDTRTLRAKADEVEWSNDIKYTRTLTERAPVAAPVAADNAVTDEGFFEKLAILMAREKAKVARNREIEAYNEALKRARLKYNKLPIIKNGPFQPVKYSYRVDPLRDDRRRLIRRDAVPMPKWELPIIEMRKILCLIAQKENKFNEMYEVFVDGILAPPDKRPEKQNTPMLIPARRTWDTPKRATPVWTVPNNPEYVRVPNIDTELTTGGNPWWWTLARVQSVISALGALDSIATFAFNEYTGSTPLIECLMKWERGVHIFIATDNRDQFVVGVSEQFASRFVIGNDNHSEFANTLRTVFQQYGTPAFLPLIRKNEDGGASALVVAIWALCMMALRSNDQRQTSMDELVRFKTQRAHVGPNRLILQ